MMLRRSCVVRSAFGQPAVARALSPPTVLDTVRQDPGQTSDYYARRYFGGDAHATTVNHLLWSELKRFGLVTLERPSGPSSPPTWHPTRFSPRRSSVQRHNPDDEDLSVLRQEAGTSQAEGTSCTSSTAAAPVESRHGEPEPPASNDPLEAVTQRMGPLILRIVAAFPNRDMPFYLQQISVEGDRMLAPAVFKQLRLDGALVRERDGSAFLWRASGGSSAAESK